MSETVQMEKVVAKDLPQVFAEVDHLRVLLINEKISRLEAQIIGLQVQLQRAQKEQEDTQKERDLLFRGLWTQYRMTDADSVDSKTGVIKRNGAEVPANAIRS